MTSHAAPILRPVVTGDEEILAPLIRNAFAVQPVPTIPPPSALEETAANIAAVLETGGGILAEVEGIPVGIVLWTRCGNAIRLRRLAVDPAWRRRGIARALLSMVEKRAQCLGIDRLTLSTRLSLVDNRRLFAGAGYVEVSFECHEGFSEPTFVNMDRRIQTS